jgi:hypothetical protein
MVMRFMISKPSSGARRRDAEERMAEFIRWAKFGRVEYAMWSNRVMRLTPSASLSRPKENRNGHYFHPWKDRLKHVIARSTAEQVVGAPRVPS